MKVTVVSLRAAEIETVLAGRLPAGVEAEFFSDPSLVSGPSLNAEIALGAPDALSQLLPRMPQLHWVQSTWAGVKPLVDAPRRDYLLTGVKDIFGQAMSEYVLGWVLALKRRIIERAVARRWDSRLEEGVQSLRMGIAGVGSIGSAVALSCAPLVGDIVGLNRSGSAVAGCRRCFAMSERLAFVRGLDVLVLLLPETPATDDFVDRELIDSLNPGAIIINAGRGNAIQMEALLDGLHSGHVRAAVLDVFTREPLEDDDALWQVPNLYISSHTAAPTPIDAIAEVFLDNLNRYRRGDTLYGLIDFERGY